MAVRPRFPGGSGSNLPEHPPHQTQEGVRDPESPRFTTRPESVPPEPSLQPALPHRARPRRQTPAAAALCSTPGTRSRAARLDPSGSRNKVGPRRRPNLVPANPRPRLRNPSLFGDGALPWLQLDLVRPPELAGATRTVTCSGPRTACRSRDPGRFGRLAPFHDGARGRLRRSGRFRRRRAASRSGHCTVSFVGTAPWSSCGEHARVLASSLIKLSSAKAKSAHRACSGMAITLALSKRGVSARRLCAPAARPPSRAPVQAAPRPPPRRAPPPPPRRCSARAPQAAPRPQAAQRAGRAARPPRRQ